MVPKVIKPLKFYCIIRASDKMELRDTAEKFFSEVDVRRDPLCKRFLLTNPKISFYGEIWKIIWSSEFMY